MASKETAAPAALAPCPEEKAFRFRDGTVARELRSFRDALRMVDVPTLEYHRGHFHPWLREVLGEDRLAKQVESAGLDERLRGDRLRDQVEGAVTHRLVELERPPSRRR